MPENTKTTGKSRYEVKALAGMAPTIYIYGDIGEDFWADESNDAKSLVQQIASIPADTPEINFRLFSYGGSVADAVAIYNAATRHPAKINTYNDGVCMSAMSLIFMAGENRYQAANALYMIHAPMAGEYGNAVAHRTMADMLDKYAEAMISSYARSGQPADVIEAMLKDGVDHYYTADEALADGFATEITETFNIAASGLQLDRYNPPAAWVAANHLQKRNKAMPEKNKQATTDPVANVEPIAPVQSVATAVEVTPTVAALTPEQVLAQESQRRNDVRATFDPFKTGQGVQAMLDAALDNPAVTVQAARDQLLTHLGSQSMPIAGNARIVMGETGGEKYVQAATQAIMARSGLEKRDGANEFRGASMMDMARASLDLAGVNHRGMDKRDVVGAAFTHSTSDFPILLENVMHKMLLTAYAKAADTWTRFCKIGDLSDFRAHGRYRTGTFGNLDPKTENNEFKHKTLSDAAKESITLGTKGNLIGISREMIINDDLGGFTDLLQSMGRAAKRTVEADVYALLASNPVLSDNVALFHSTHGNLAGTGAAVSTTTLEAARVAMAIQKDIGGNDFLDIRPGIFVGGMLAGVQARIANESQYDPDATNKLQKPNTTLGLFTDVVDSPRISGNEWYTFADPNDAPVIEVGFLDGNQEPYLEMKEGFSQDGVMYKVRLDYGVAAIGYEGAYKNAGA